VALVISANPELAGQVDIIEDIIEQTAVPKTTDQNCGDIPGTQVPNHTYGYGRVDALAAVEAAIALIPPPPSATHEESRLSVKVYPNPVDNQLFIETKNAVGEIQVQLFDINGKLIIERSWSAGYHSKTSLDLTGKLAGVYFYRIINGMEIRQGIVVKA